MRPPVSVYRDWRFPRPEVRSLPNGLCIWAFHLPGQHVISTDLVLAVGVSAEPREKEGIATVALMVADESTAAHPHGRMAELLENQGALVGGHQGHYAAHLRLDVPSTRLGGAWPLFTELVRQPAPDEEDVAHHIDVLIAEHAQRLSSPRGTTALAYRRALYAPEDRRVRPESGTPTTLARITRDDVARFQTETWGPHQAVLVVAGDLPDGALDGIEESLADWAPSPVIADDPPQPLPNRRVVVVDRPQAVQADITIGTYTIGRTDPRAPAATIGGHVMAGAFTSRLNLELRERRGYTYGVSGGFAPGRYGGLFTIATSCRTEVAGAAIGATLDQLALDEPVSSAELSAARDFVLGVGPLATETAEDVVTRAARLVEGRTDVDGSRQHADAIATLIPGDVTQAYRSLISPEALSIAVTGRAEVLVPALIDLGCEPEVIAFA